MFEPTPLCKHFVPATLNNSVNYCNLDDVFLDEADLFFGNMSLNPGHRPFKLDIKDSKLAYIIKAELPKISKQNIKLDIYQDHLTISVTRDKPAEISWRHLHREGSTRAVERTIYLKNIKNNGIKAKFENGVLTVYLQKSSLGEQKNCNEAFL